jgi:hypothetical protein
MTQSMAASSFAEDGLAPAALQLVHLNAALAAVLARLTGDR